MNRSTALLVGALIVAVVAAPVAATQVAPGQGVAQESAPNGTQESPTNESAANVSPGARLAGTVASQNASLSGEVEQRAFGIRLNRADTPAAKAGVVAGAYDDLSARLDALRERQQRLAERHENGTLPEPAYHAQAAQLAAQIRSLEQRANATADAARGLPADELDAHGVNATAIQRLRKNAANLTGPEIAAIARTIGGDRGPPGSAGPPGAGPPDGTPGAGGPADGGPSDGAPADDGTTESGDTDARDDKRENSERSDDERENEQSDDGTDDDDDGSDSDDDATTTADT